MPTNWSRSVCPRTPYSLQESRSIWAQNRYRGQMLSAMYFALQRALAVADEDLVHEVPIGAHLPDADVRAQITQIQADIRQGEAPPSPALDGHTCDVCWDAFNETEKFPAVMGCGHCICFECMGKLTELRCGRCRKRIERFVRLFM